jgi:predicted Rossmann-fold nucleotide-binding protein
MPRRLKTNKYGKPYNAMAGFIRNEKMAEYADALAIFPGGNGTEHMYEVAVKHGVKIYDFRTKKPKSILIKKGG